MLIRNKEDFDTALKLSGDFEFDKIADFVAQVEEEEVVPWLSQEQYDSLDTGINDNTLDEKETKLLQKVRRAIAFLGIHSYAPFGSLQFKSSGIQQKEDGNNRAPAQWRIREMQQTAMQRGTGAIDSALAYLELYKDDFTAWRDSGSFTVFKESFLSTSQQMTRYVQMVNGSRSLFLKAKPSIFEMEETHVSQAMGEEFFLAFKEKWKDPLQTLTADEFKILRFVQAGLSHLAFADSLLLGTVNYDEKGAYVYKTNNSHTVEVREPAKSEQVSTLVTVHNRKGEKYIADLVTYLESNQESFPLYVPKPTEYAKPIDHTDKKYYSN